MDHVLIALAVLAGWALFVYVRPTKACGSCAGREGPCPRCRGTGRRFRVGARLVRRGAVMLYLAAREHAWPWLRDRIDGSMRDQP